VGASVTAGRREAASEQRGKRKRARMIKNLRKGFLVEAIASLLLLQGESRIYAKEKCLKNNEILV
jgi:hypothetical protein